MSRDLEEEDVEILNFRAPNRTHSVRRRCANSPVRVGEVYRTWPECVGVYVARMPKTDMVKIGHSRNIRKRLESFLCAVPWRYELLLYLPHAGREEERTLHARFAASRLRGGAGHEWFWLTKDVVDYIRAARNGDEP